MQHTTSSHHHNHRNHDPIWRPVAPTPDRQPTPKTPPTHLSSSTPPNYKRSVTQQGDRSSLEQSYQDLWDTAFANVSPVRSNFLAPSSRGFGRSKEWLMLRREEKSTTRTRVVVEEVRLGKGHGGEVAVDGADMVQGPRPCLVVKESWAERLEAWVLDYFPPAGDGEETEEGDTDAELRIAALESMLRSIGELSASS